MKKEYFEPILESVLLDQRDVLDVSGDDTNSFVTDINWEGKI